MPPPFQSLDIDEFRRLLGRFPFERSVDAVHLHHAGHIRRAEWHGYETLRAMWYTHTLQQGWSDLAQHLTVDPDGILWTGRDWNRPPCSCPFKNGDTNRGPFMITLIGDFNNGGDRFDNDSPQYRQTIEVVARIQMACKREPDTHPQSAQVVDSQWPLLRFHRDLDLTKKCPGETIDLGLVNKDVADRRVALAADPGVAAPRDATPPFGEDVEGWYEFITISSQNRGQLHNESADSPRSTGEPPKVDATDAGKIS